MLYINMVKITTIKFTEIQVFEVPPHSVHDLIQAIYIKFTRANMPTQYYLLILFILLKKKYE